MMKFLSHFLISYGLVFLTLSWPLAFGQDPSQPSTSVDGFVQDAERLEAEIEEKIKHLQILKDSFEVRLLKKPRLTNGIERQPLINQPTCKGILNLLTEPRVILLTTFVGYKTYQNMFRFSPQELELLNTLLTEPKVNPEAPNLKDSK